MIAFPVERHFLDKPHVDGMRPGQFGQRAQVGNILTVHDDSIDFHADVVL